VDLWQNKLAEDKRMAKEEAVDEKKYQKELNVQAKMHTM